MTDKHHGIAGKIHKLGIVGKWGLAREEVYIPALIHIDHTKGRRGRRRIVYMGEANESERDAFYRSLLRPGTPEKIRRAIMQELGISHRERKREIERSHARGLWFWVESRKAAMRKDKERPRGGIHEAAIAEVASANGLTVAALKKRFQRHCARKERCRFTRDGIDDLVADMVRLTQLRAMFPRQRA
jgi:hypothetical protein